MNINHQIIDGKLCQIALSLDAVQIIAASLSTSQGGDFDLAVSAHLQLAHLHLDELHDVLFPQASTNGQ